MQFLNNPHPINPQAIQPNEYSNQASNNTYTSFFNLLKFLGSIFIVIFHLGCMYYRLGYGENNNFLSLPDNILYNFQLITEMFFIISGYLAVKSYQKYGTLKLREKIKKTYEISFITITLMFLIKMCFCNVTESGLGYTSFISYLVQLLVLSPQILSIEVVEGLNSPLWYMATLMLCYIIIEYSQNNRNIYMPLILAGLFMFIFHFEYPILNSWIGRGIASFFTGCELFYFINSRSRYSKLEKITMTLLELSIFIYLINNKNKIFYPLILLFFAIAIAFLCKCALVEKFTNNKIFTFLGRASYYIYVCGAICYQGVYIYLYNTHAINNINMYFFLALLLNILLGMSLTLLMNKRNCKRINS